MFLHMSKAYKKKITQNTQEKGFGKLSENVDNDGVH